MERVKDWGQDQLQKLICGRTSSDLITADPAVADLLHFTKRCRKAEMMHVLSGFYGANSRAYVQFKMTIFKTYFTKLPEEVDRLNTYNLDCMLHQVLLLKTKISNHLKTLETSVITACKGTCDSKASSREGRGRNKNTKNTKSAFHTHAWRPLGYAAIVALCCQFLFGKETVWNTNNVELLTLKGNMQHRETGRYRLQKAAWTKTFPSVSVIPQNESGQSVSLHTDSRPRISCCYRSARERTVHAQVHRPFQTQHCCWDCCSSCAAQDSTDLPCKDWGWL